MKKSSLVVPWIVVGLSALYFAMRMSPPPIGSDKMDTSAFGAITIQDRGRYKPFDTYFRTVLMGLTYRQKVSVKDPASDDEKSIDSTRWGLDLLALGLRDYYHTIAVNKPQVLKALGVDPLRIPRFKLVDWQKAGVLEKLGKLAKAARQKNPAAQNKLEQDLVALDDVVQDRIRLIGRITNGMKDRGIAPDKVKLFRIETSEVLAMLGLQQRPGFRYSYEEIIANEGNFANFMSQGNQLEEFHERGEKFESAVQARTYDLWQQINQYWALSELRTPLVVPVADEGRWQPLGIALLEMELTGKENRPARLLAESIFDYASNQPELFNKGTDDYLGLLAERLPAKTGTSHLEVFFNDFSPFYLCCVFYVIILVFCCLSWMGWLEMVKVDGGAEVATQWSNFWSGWRQTCNRTAFALAVLVLLVHTWALCTRMYIMGRPPVTNLYSSAIFIGWGCVLLCLILEGIYHNGIGTLVASVTGFLTLFVAQHLDGGDTMEVLQAVLDTNFWLATHVVCITLGYTATFVAGFLGVAYIFMGFVTPLMRTAVPSKQFANMIYGVACFATLLSFVGTVLGGIWADQSWGRFWGWDPKENGALLIVIWNALLLHARWGGMVKDRGMAVLAVAGNMITGWSWFGTNQLGVGLHAYGFNDKLATGLVIFWISQVLFIVLGCLPLRLWKSFSPTLAPVVMPPVKNPPRKGPKLRPA